MDERPSIKKWSCICKLSRGTIVTPSLTLFGLSVFLNAKFRIFGHSFHFTSPDYSILCHVFFQEINSCCHCWHLQVFFGLPWPGYSAQYTASAMNCFIVHVPRIGLLVINQRRDAQIIIQLYQACSVNRLDTTYL